MSYTTGSELEISTKKRNYVRTLQQALNVAYLIRSNGSGNGGVLYTSKVLIGKRVKVVLVD